MTTTSPPRRNWHFTRWLIVCIVATLGWSGWRAYAFRSVVAEARSLGWGVIYTDPVETIRENWKAAFEKETWLDRGTHLDIPTSEEFEQHLAIVYRLNPKALIIDDAATLRDLSALSPLTRLEDVSLEGCTGLTNVDALKSLSALQTFYLGDCEGLTNVDALKKLTALQHVSLDRCTGLTNVDALKSLSALQSVWLAGCTGLTNMDAIKNLPSLSEIVINDCTGLTEESVAALRAALPNAEITGP